MAKPLSVEMVAGGGKQISFRRRIPGGTQLDYQIEKSNDLIEWRADPGDGLMFSEVSVERNGDASETVVIEDVEGTGGQPTFYRLRVGF